MKILVKAIGWTSLISFPTFLLTIPNPPAIAGSVGFDSCAESLIGSGITKSAATGACAAALKPNDLGSCVEDIKTTTNITGDNALQACYRVRRPEELASCVTDISTNFDQGKSTMALDNCRRSLLPKRYAECTVDLANTAKISSEEAMTSCIAAEFKPSKLASETSK